MSNNVRALLEERSAASPDKHFLFSEADRRKWTYAEFNRLVNQTANLLKGLGVQKGSVVSLLLPNSPEYVAAYFACWKIGAIAGPINSLLKPEEVNWAIENSDSRLLVASSSLASALLPGPTPILIFDNVAEVVASQPEDLAGVDIAEDEEAIIIYTSGTTGKPKGCLLTHQNLIANARQIAEWMSFGPDDRLLTVMPLFHMNAVSVTTMTALYASASTVVSPKFSASRHWQIVEEFGITSFGSVATMLSMLLARHSERGEYRKSPRLRFAMCGSAPVPGELLKQFESTFDCLVIEGYGLSESTCRSTFNPPNENRRPGSCGQPIGNEMRVVDDAGNDVPPGELGEIVLRGPNICKGYFKDRRATEQAFKGGWFHTGDIGFRDTDDFYYIADRKSDMIIRGGENIYPREIDDVLYAHPAVRSAAAIGVPDELYGEDVAAFVVRRDGAQVSESELIEHCKVHLADYKCPKRIYFLDEIPKGPTGKLLKRELAKLLPPS